ncbi:hypothetical protein RFI_06515 [Reticulomyxa filosa]|uniref:Inositol polyphosphate-related phosphatase domain-containing protein n=1 Tax=Reticulomyxa filosa TaxID=46433 RepID=X6NZ98_RETFI|nr:hypothetical protein RFI_06515 [Reticulomyxa filosa]|eukprot:ETO30607.1 hypothetical protein RFI_06515 [Reticulomyxa filosa]
MSEIEEQKCEAITKIWVCTWNMGAKSHFPTITSEDGTKRVDTSKMNELMNIVPANYDVYVFGVQEGVDDGYFDLLTEYFKPKKVKRFRISLKEDRVEGRGDGSFISSKYTGIGVYFKKDKKNVIQLKRAGAVSAGMMEGSKGAAGIVLKIYGVSIYNCFIYSLLLLLLQYYYYYYYYYYYLLINSSRVPSFNCHKSQITKHTPYPVLGLPAFHLLEQFHHVVWFGDLNYRLEDITGEQVSLFLKKKKIRI